MASRTALALVVLLLAAPAAAAQTVVSPANLQGWQLQTVPGTVESPATPPSTVFETGPVTPPLGAGSLQLSPGSDGDAGAAARNPNFDGVRLDQLTALAYSTYVDQPGTGSEAPYLVLTIDLDGDPVTSDDGDGDLWFFEPEFQGAAFVPPGVSPQGPVAVDTWQSWDAAAGAWYATSGLAGSGPGTDVVSLDTLRAAAPNAILRNAAGDFGGAVRVATGLRGGAWNNFVGNLDAFQITTTQAAATFDFDPVTDRDGDGIPDGSDNCPDTPNQDQGNNDKDGAGDACDEDDDNDGVSDAAEAELGTSPTDGDSDDDGRGDDDDPCPTSPGPDNGCPKPDPAPPVPEDRPPTVDLTGPAANATVDPTAGATLSATAADDRGVSQVAFIDADGLICSDTTAPYECRYDPTGDDVGKNTIIAVASDTAGQIGIDVVRIEVIRFVPRSVSLGFLPRRDATIPFRFVARGTIALPDGVTRAQGCSGTVSVRLLRGRLTVGSGNATVRSNCTYARAFVVPFAQEGTLRGTARFNGNTVLRPRSARSSTVRAG